MDAIYKASRLEGDDPVANWAEHTVNLKERVKWLNDQNFAALKYTGPGTDLMLGLADGHIWKGGASPALNGVTCQPNIPTEEVFTCPHAYKVDGTVSATMPLAYRFEAGRIVDATASKGESVLKDLLKTDDGASRIGEVALVPHSSPISQSGTLFYNTLFDENAQSLIHVDWMMGSDAVDIDGIHKDGTITPVFRKGEWA